MIAKNELQYCTDAITIRLFIIMIAFVMHRLKFAAFPKYATVLMNDQVMEFCRNKILATRCSK